VRRGRNTEVTEKRTEGFLSRDRSTILRFAVVGLGVPVVWVVYQALIDPSPWSHTNDLLSGIFMILCPPLLLTFTLFDVEIGTGGLYVLCTVVALLNAALYAVVGRGYVGLRKKREGSASS
jgi:hypothetical protein